MSTVKCEICNREVESLFIVSHKERGQNKDMRGLFEAGSEKPAGSKELRLLLRRSVYGMYSRRGRQQDDRLIGDAEKAELQGR